MSLVKNKNNSTNKQTDLKTIIDYDYIKKFLMRFNFRYIGKRRKS